MEKNTRQLYRVPGAQTKAHLGNIYIVSDNSDAETELHKVFGDSTVGMFYVPYAPVCINDLEMVPDKVLAETAESLGANVFTQVFMPDQDAPMFLFETGEKATLGITAIEMLYAAEEFAKESVCAAIRNFALNNPDKCNKWLNSPEDEKDFAIAKKTDFIYNAIAFGRSTSMGPSFKGVCNYTAEVSPRQAAMMEKFKKARENFVRYVQEIQKGESENAEEAEKMIDWVLKDLSERQKNKVMKLYLKEMDAAALEDFFGTFLDPDNIVRKSKIKLSVEKAADCINNDGFYRVYYQFADFEKRPMHFSHKPACIVYLMLLMCRKKDKEMNTFFAFDKKNVADKELFVKLMTTVYEKKSDEAALDYNNLFTDDYGAQGRLKDYIKDCKDIFEEAVGNYESPYPFTPKKINSNGREFVLPILPDNITFSDSFTELFPIQ